MSTNPPPGRPKMQIKWWMWAGGGAVLYFGYRWYKNKSAAASTTATDTSGIDPNTGIPYSQEGNYLDSSSSGAYGGGYGTTPSLYGYYDPTTGQFIGSGTQSTGVIAPSTNAAWMQQAESYMTQIGYDPLTVATALGKYLAGVALSNDEMQIVQAAIGFEGQPPSPPALPPHTSPPAGQTPTSTSGAAHHYAVQLHKISVATSARGLVQQWSDASVATPNGVQTALVQTTLDPRNARYMPYYGSHGGAFPAQAAIYLHVIKAGS